MKTANDIYDEVNADLAGLNGKEARENTIVGLARLQTEVLEDQLTIFGSANVKVLQLGGEALVSIKR